MIASALASETSMRVNKISATIGVLYQRHAHRLLPFAFARTRHHHVADDVCQEIWIRVATKLHTFSGGSFRAWLFKIAENEIANHFRRNKGTVGLEERDVACHESRRKWSSSDRRLDALAECIETLGTDRAMVIRLTLEGCTHEEIATRLKIPANTSMTRYHRAKEELEACIDRKMFDDDRT